MPPAPRARSTLCLLLLAVPHCACLRASLHPTLAPPHHGLRARPSLCSLDDQREVWQFREGAALRAYALLLEWKAEEAARRRRRAEEAGAAGKAAFVASAAAVVVGALVLRLGGRAALVSLLGLDAVSELGVGGKIDEVLAYADGLGAWALLAFLGAWVVAKVFLVDVLSLALAFSSGVLFGGVLEGALLSSLGATLGSLAAFSLSRTLLADKAREAIAARPVARGLAKVVEDDGFKTVFVLRLSPVLPLPTGAYPYIYGTSRLRALPFAAGYFLGSLKPYLLDAYLGVVSKQLLDGEAMDGEKDLLLLVGVGALVLVGVFAGELAAESWEQVRAEVRVHQLEAASAPHAEVWDGMIGPLNASGAVSRRVRQETAEVWQTLVGFCEALWPQAQREELRKRGELPAAAEESAEKAQKAETMARLAAWSLDGPQPWRQLYSATLFSVALAATCRKYWEDIEAPAAQTAAASNATLADGPLAAASNANASTEARRAEIDARMAQIDAQIERLSRGDEP